MQFGPNEVQDVPARSRQRECLIRSDSREFWLEGAWMGLVRGTEMMRRLYDKMNSRLSGVDMGFTALRTLVALVALAWLLFTPDLQELFRFFVFLFVGFCLYSFALVAALVKWPDEARKVYLVGAVLDAACLFALLCMTGWSQPPSTGLEAFSEEGRIIVVEKAGPSSEAEGRLSLRPEIVVTPRVTTNVLLEHRCGAASSYNPGQAAPVLRYFFFWSASFLSSSLSLNRVATTECLAGPGLYLM